ncbi:MAG: hypothetical protein H0U65_16070 [Rubrobacter sp.]|nr:hypothetical protein [Rubrobacter sp.]
MRGRAVGGTPLISASSRPSRRGWKLAISDAGVSELVRVMSYPDVEALVTTKPGGLARVISAAVNLVTIGTLHHLRSLHWPNLNDANDSWMLDLALEAEPACIVTRDDGVLRDAPKSGFDATAPPEFVKRENL